MHPSKVCTSPSELLPPQASPPSLLITFQTEHQVMNAPQHWSTDKERVVIDHFPEASPPSILALGIKCSIPEPDGRDFISKQTLMFIELFMLISPCVSYFETQSYSICPHNRGRLRNSFFLSPVHCFFLVCDTNFSVELGVLRGIMWGEEPVVILKVLRLVAKVGSGAHWLLSTVPSG